MGWVVRFSPISAIGDTDATNDEVVQLREAVELTIAGFWDQGTTGVFEGPDGEVIAGFDSEPLAIAAARSAEKRLVLGTGATVEPAAPPEQWADDSIHTIEVRGRDRRFDFTIAAGAAFGHGAHPTTRLVLAQMLDLIDPSTEALDIGSGTGVLSVAAALAGASSVIAIDNDPVAVAMTIENAGRNRTRIQASDATIDQVLAERSTGFDLILINVLLPVHVELGPAVRRAIAPGGSLVTAGYLDDQTPQLIDRYTGPAAGSPSLRVAANSAENGWASHRFRRPSS